MSTAINVLSDLQKKGVKIWTEEGRLRYQAPKGSLTSDDLDRLRSFKEDIVDLLRQSQSLSESPPLSPRSLLDSVPLTFQQQSVWSLLQLQQARYSVRGVASALRISGPLDVDSLKKSVQAVIKRHDTLRTRIVVVDGTPTQHIDEPTPEMEPCVVDLPELPGNEIEFTAKRLVEEFVNKKVDLSKGPLFEAKIFNLSNRDHVFVTAMDRIISDGFSSSILAREIWTAYSQASAGMPISLPEMRFQFADYAVWQQKTNQWWLEEHGTHWRERFTDAPREPWQTESRQNLLLRLEQAPIELGRTLTEGLRALSQREHTTLSIAVLTIFVALMLRWQEKYDQVVELMVEGRDQPELVNVIGALSSTLYLRVQLQENETFRDLLKRVTKEYYNTYKHYDHGRLFTSQFTSTPIPSLLRSIHFNWQQMPPHGANNVLLPPHIGQSHSEQLDAKPFDFHFDGIGPLGLGRSEPGAMVFEVPGGISGWFFWAADLYQSNAMTRFVRNFELFAERFINEPDVLVMSLPYE